MIDDTAAAQERRNTEARLRQPTPVYDVRSERTREAELRPAAPSRTFTIRNDAV